MNYAITLIHFFLLSFASANLMVGGSTERRRYEVGIHPNNFCPTSKVCPDVNYRNSSSFYKHLKVCTNSHECSGYEICCDEVCNQSKYCMKPAQWIDDHDGKCPTLNSSCERWPFTLRPRCRQDTDCYLDAKCCLDPCLLSKVCYQIISKESSKINWDAFLGNISATIHITSNKDVTRQKPVIEQVVKSNENHRTYKVRQQQNQLDRDEIIFNSERKHLIAPPEETFHYDVYANKEFKARREQMVKHAMINLGGISMGIMGSTTKKRGGINYAEKNVRKRERSFTTGRPAGKKYSSKKSNCLENFSISSKFGNNYYFILIASTFWLSYSIYFS